MIFGKYAQFPADRCMIQLRSALFGNNGNIRLPGQGFVACAKKLSHQTLHAVASNRTADLPTDRQSQTGRPVFYTHDDDDEMGRVPLTPHLSNSIEFTAFM